MQRKGWFWMAISKIVHVVINFFKGFGLTRKIRTSLFRVQSQSTGLRTHPCYSPASHGRVLRAAVKTRIAVLVARSPNPPDVRWMPGRKGDGLN